MDREAWRAAIHGVTKSWTRLSNWTELNDISCGASFQILTCFVYIFFSEVSVNVFDVLFKKLYLFFNWRIIALQNFVVFIKPQHESAISSVQFSSVAQLCPTTCDPMNRSTPGLPVHHQLPEFTKTHVHWVSDAIQPSHPLSSPSLPAPNPSQHRVFCNESTLRMRWPKY